MKHILGYTVFNENFLNKLYNRYFKEITMYRNYFTKYWNMSENGTSQSLNEFEVNKALGAFFSKDGKILMDCIVQKNGKLLFYITDTGMGLTFYDKMRIFSKFFRSKKAVLAYPDGTGLRLYLSKQIIKLHGGKIYAKSEGENKGSAFFIELPLSR